MASTPEVDPIEIKAIRDRRKLLETIASETPLRNYENELRLLCLEHCGLKRLRRRYWYKIQGHAAKLWKKLPEIKRKEYEELAALSLAARFPSVSEDSQESISESNIDSAGQSQSTQSLHETPKKLRCSKCKRSVILVPIRNAKGQTVTLVAPKSKINNRALEKLRSQIREHKAKVKKAGNDDKHKFKLLKSLLSTPTPSEELNMKREMEKGRQGRKPLKRKIKTTVDERYPKRKKLDIDEQLEQIVNDLNWKPTNATPDADDSTGEPGPINNRKQKRKNARYEPY